MRNGRWRKEEIGKAGPARTATGAGAGRSPGGARRDRRAVVLFDPAARAATPAAVGLFDSARVP